MPRVGWPDVFQYRSRDKHGREVLTACPPKDGRPYRIVEHDRDGYLRLCRSGEAFSPEHTGRTFRFFDRRMTS